MSSESEQPSTSSRQGLRRLPRNVWVLTLLSFFSDISSEMIVHLIPLFLANVLGVRTITIGFIEGVVGKLFSSLRSFPYNTLPQKRKERTPWI